MKKNINTKLIRKYFRIETFEVGDNGKIKFTLKDRFKEGKDPVFKDKLKKYPYSGASEKYYINYLGEEIGAKVGQSRRRLLFKTNQIDGYIENFKCSEKLVNKLINIKNYISNKCNKSRAAYFQSKEGKAYVASDKFKAKRKVAGKRISELWKNKEWRKKQINDRKSNGMYKKISKNRKKRFKNDPDFVEKMKKVYQDDDRRRKISIAAKKMGKNVRENDKDKYYRMLLSSKNKNFKLNDKFMNQPEYIVGTILNEYDLDGEYERIFSNKNQGYLPDFTIENKKVVVEIYGDFGHANPKFFNKLDETHKGRKAFEIWAYDKKREEFFIKNGYKFIKIGEDDINKNINYVRKVLYDKTR